MHFLKLENWSYSLIHGLQNRCFLLTDLKTRLISLYIPIRALGWPGALSMCSSILKDICSFWVVGLNSGLKIFIKSCCKQMCRHPGFVVSFVEHRQSRFSIILKDPRIFLNGKMSMDFKLTSPAALAPNKRVSLSCGVLKPSIDFSSLAIKVLDGVFFQYKAVSSTWKVCCWM